VLSQAVTYTPRHGTTLAASDYRAANGILTFAQGEAAKKIAIAVLGDTATGPDGTPPGSDG
jgi:Calx-beta domain-containing protein